MASLCIVTSSAQLYRQHKSIKDVSTGKVSQQVANASNELCFSVLRHLHPKGNVFFSPLSISMSMGLVYLGARSNTAEEMYRFLGYESQKLEPTDVHSGYKQIMDMIARPSESRDTPTAYTLETANAMLVERGYDILQAFKDNGQKYYDAAVESVSFSSHPESALDSVNGWVSWKTHNKITKILEQHLDPLTKIFLLNAVYFKGSWKYRFDQRLTMPDTFYNSGQIPKTVPMMRQKRKLNYGFINHLSGYALELPYTGNDIKLLLLLPEKRDGLQHMESLLTYSLVEEIASNLREVTVQVTLPRFTLEEEYDMVSVLKSMGMNSLFDPAEVDLTGISPRKGLYITKILHKSVVEVNEEGSEAATVTGVAAGVRTGGPLIPHFTADHPFIFFIRHEITNSILFVGRVDNL